VPFALWWHCLQFHLLLNVVFSWCCPVLWNQEENYVWNRQARSFMCNMFVWLLYRYSSIVLFIYYKMINPTVVFIGSWRPLQTWRNNARYRQFHSSILIYLTECQALLNISWHAVFCFYGDLPAPRPQAVCQPFHASRCLFSKHAHSLFITDFNRPHYPSLWHDGESHD
jgi:hypothetical protein